MKNRFKYKIQDILICNSCHGKLMAISSSLQCTQCGCSYLCKDGVHIMYDVENAPDDIRLSAQSWGDIYKKMDVCEINEYYDFYTTRLYSEIIEHIWNYSPCDHHGIFLEIGSGLGVMGIHLAKEGYQVICIDVCFEVLKRAKELYAHHNCDAIFICGNILNMPIKSNIIDLIFGRGVIEHFKDTQTAISELYRVTHPGGKVINTVPPISLSTILYRLPDGNIPDVPLIRNICEWVFTSFFKNKLSVHGYELSFTARKIRCLFQKAKFTSVEVGHTGFFVPINKLKSEKIKCIVRKLFHFRLFWHSMYINATKAKSDKE